MMIIRPIVMAVVPFPLPAGTLHTPAKMAPSLPAFTAAAAAGRAGAPLGPCGSHLSWCETVASAWATNPAMSLGLPVCLAACKPKDRHDIRGRLLCIDTVVSSV